MDAVRVGAAFRAVRLRHGWRQIDVAVRTGLSDSTISRIERGHLESLAVATVMHVASVLEIRLDWLPRWRGGELDRMLNAGHAAMHEAATRSFAGTEWRLLSEATFAIYGERGAIDILAFHPPTRALLVIELKTDLVDVQGLIGAMDRYRRLAPAVARQRGWDSRGISCWVVLRESPANRRRLAAHRSVLRNAFPADGRQIRGWLQRPVGPMSGLSFLSPSRRWGAIASSAGVQRVRRAS